MSDILNKMLSKIEYQLGSNGFHPPKLINERSIYREIKEKKAKLSDDRSLVLKEDNNNNKPNRDTQRTNNQPFTSVLERKNTESHKVKVREREQGISYVRSELNSTIETFRKESKDVSKNQLDLEGYMQMISSNSQSIAKLDDYTKGEVLLLSEKTSELNSNYVFIRDNISEMNQRIAELTSDVKYIKEEANSKKANTNKATQENKFEGITETKVRQIIEEKLNEFSKTMETKMNQIICSLNKNNQYDQRFGSIVQSIEEIKNTNENHERDINRISNILYTNEKEIQKQKDSISLLTSSLNKIQETVSVTKDNNSLQANFFNQQQSIKDINEQCSSLSNQTKKVMDQIASLESKHITLSNELNGIKGDNAAINLHQQSNNDDSYNQFIKVKEELSVLSTTLNHYKTEQRKLNELNEKILKTVSNQVLCLNKDTNTLIEKEEDNNDTLERIQENFNKIDSIVVQYGKMKKDFALMAETVNNLTISSQNLQNKLNMNSDGLDNWKKEIEETIAKKVDFVKNEYCDKGSQNKNANSNLAKEFNTKLDQLEMLSHTKYVTKIDFEILKMQIEEIERKIKGNKTKEKTDESRKNSKNSINPHRKKEDNNEKTPSSKDNKIKKKEDYSDN